MRKPDLFIIGAPKSGTTSMYDLLGGHPQIFMSALKEPLYFSPDVRSGANRQRLEHPRDEARYIKLFAGARDERRLGEATTRYLVSRVAASLVADFQPQARAIAMLRDPVDMLHALHNERVSQGHEPIEDFSDALAADAQRARGELLPDGSNELGSVYRESARYADGLMRWFDALGRDRVHVMIFEDFTRDPATEFARVLEFLEVDGAYQPASFAARNASHRQRRVVRLLVDSPAGDWLTHKLLGTLVGADRRARLALRFRQSRLNRRAAPRSAIDPTLRASLGAELRPDVERLGELLGRDLVSLWLAT